MGKVKVALWIGVLFIVQDVFYPILSLSGIVPDLLLGFSVCYAALEQRIKKVSPVIVICAILCGAGTGRVFSVAVFITGIAGVMAYQLSDYVRFIPRALRVLLIVMVSAFLMSVSEYFVSAQTITYNFIANTALWHTAYTVATAFVIYLILKKTMLSDEKKILLIQERD